MIALVSDVKIEKSMVLVMETEKETSREATGVYDLCALQHTATRCNTLQHAGDGNGEGDVARSHRYIYMTHSRCKTL